MTTVAALLLALEALLAALLALLWWVRARDNRAYRLLCDALLDTQGSAPGFHEALGEWLRMTDIPLERRVRMIRANIGFRAAREAESLDFTGEILDVMTSLQTPARPR